MSVHEQHYPPQTMPRITRLLVDIPVRYVVGKVYDISPHQNHTMLKHSCMFRIPQLRPQ